VGFNNQEHISFTIDHFYGKTEFSETVTPADELFWHDMGHGLTTMRKMLSGMEIT